MICKCLFVVLVCVALVSSETTAVPTTTTPTTSIPTTTSPTTVPPTLSPTVLPSVSPSPVPTESPTVEESPMLEEITDKNHKIWQGTALGGTIFPFQTQIILSEPIPALYVNITNNSTILLVEGTLLRRSNPLSMPPNFDLPLDFDVVTSRLQTLPCVPDQGGFYYRNDPNIDFGDVDNEVVNTRGTDSIGGYVVNATRPFQVRPEDANSIVLYSATHGAILCANLEWNLVDGSLSSFISILTLSIAMFFIVRKTVF